jgi:hypothetical protein
LKLCIAGDGLKKILQLFVLQCGQDRACFVLQQNEPRTEREQTVTAMRPAHGCHAKKHGTDPERRHNFATIGA